MTLIRIAIPDDAAAIAALNAAAWQTAFRGVVSDDYLDRYDGCPEQRRTEIENLGPDAIQLVAVDRDVVVG